MRRLSMIGIATAVLLSSVAAPPTVPATAQTPGAIPAPDVDYCTAAPDVPLGWWFNDACRGHDECLDALADPRDGEGRRTCDRAFLHDMLRAPHVLSAGTCARDGACPRVAYLYYVAVRAVSTLVSGRRV